MRVAVAGSGDLARYICEEFTKADHEVVVLTRTEKDQFNQKGVTQFVTDYSLESLSIALVNSQALISTISDISSSYIDVHRILIQACQQSPTCKRFIPSEFAGDIQAYPDQPGFYYRTREPIRQALREQKDIEWTVICCGWLADYLVPCNNRYIKDIGNCHPIDLTNGGILIPGAGNEPVDFTWARDIGKALVALVDTSSAWEQYTYLSGERSCWNDVAQIIVQKYQSELTVNHISLYQIADAFRASNDEDSQVLSDYYLFSVSQSSSVPQAEVQRQKQKFFPDVHFRTLDDGFLQLHQDSGLIL